MTQLLDVAEGILDSAASEYLEYNLASVENVQAYAENGCGIYLSDSEAQKVLYICKAWIKSDLNDDNDYYYAVKKPLLGDEATI